MPSLIDVRHPAPGDLVGSEFLVVGLGSGFEGDLYYRVLGTGEATLTSGRMRGGAYSMREFHTTIELDPAAVDGAEGTLEVFWRTPASPQEDPDGPEKDTVRVPITFAFTYLPEFAGVHRYVVQEGDTLTSIARDYSPEVSAEHIFASNRDVLTDPDEIEPGQVLRVPAAL